MAGIFDDIDPPIRIRSDPGVTYTCPECWTQWVSYDPTCWVCEKPTGSTVPKEMLEKLAQHRAANL